MRGRSSEGEFQERSPDRRWQMDQCHPASTQNEEPAQSDEEDESEMVKEDSGTFGNRTDIALVRGYLDRCQ